MATYQHEHPFDSDHSPSAALARVVDTGQRMLRDRLDLLRLEIQETARGLVRATTLGALGGSFLALGWLCLVGAVIARLNGPLPLWAALVVVGAVHVVVGGVALLVARAQRHPPHLEVKDSALDPVRPAATFHAPAT